MSPCPGKCLSVGRIPSSRSPPAAVACDSDYSTFRRRQQALLPSYPSTKYKILFSSYALPFIYTWYLFMSPSISIIIGFKCFHNQIFIFAFLQSDERCKCKIKVKTLKNLYLFYPSKPKKSRKPSILQSFRLEANSGNRTRDLRITSASLYRLSHVSLPVPLYHLFWKWQQLFFNCFHNVPAIIQNRI